MFMAMKLESSIRQFLESQREQIVDFIEQHSIPDNITSDAMTTGIVSTTLNAYCYYYRYYN